MKFEMKSGINKQTVINKLYYTKYVVFRLTFKQ